MHRQHGRILLKTITWLFAGLMVLLVLGFIASRVFQKQIKQAENTQTQVWTQTVTQGQLTEIVAAPGTVEPLTKVEISARVSAKVTQLPFKPGDTVTASTAENPCLLVQLDDSDLKSSLTAAISRRDSLLAQYQVDQARIESATASLAGTKAALNEAKRELQRQQELLETGDTSHQTVEQAQRAYEQAQAQFQAEEKNKQASQLGLKVSQHNIKAAEADIQRIQDSLAYTTITSPIDGVVTKLNVEVGETAITGTMNNPGTVLIEVADLSQMLVVAQIDESDIRHVQVGQKANVRIAGYSDTIFEGRVYNVALAATNAGNGMSKYFEAKILLDQTSENIRTGLSADIEIQVKTHENVLLVPNAAILSRPIDQLPDDLADREVLVDETRSRAIVVLIAKEGAAHMQPVDIGPSDEKNTIIESGLTQTDQVISGPFAELDLIQHDQKIQVTRHNNQPVTTTTTTITDTPTPTPTPDTNNNESPKTK